MIALKVFLLTVALLLFITQAIYAAAVLRVKKGTITFWPAVIASLATAILWYL